MPGQGRIIGQDNIVGDLAVMGHMGSDHEQAIITNRGDHPAALGPGW